MFSLNDFQLPHPQVQEILKCGDGYDRLNSPPGKGSHFHQG
jgi:hypothetical protein